MSDAAEDLGAPDSIDDGDEMAALEEANRRLRIIRDIDAEIAQTRQLYGAEIDRLSARLNAQLETLLRKRAWYEAPVTALHRALLERRPERKTIRLPYGELVARARQPKWHIDDAVFTAWALPGDKAGLRLEPKVMVSELKKAYQVTPYGQVITDEGECVPGVQVEDMGISFTVKVATDGE